MYQWDISRHFYPLLRPTNLANKRQDIFLLYPLNVNFPTTQLIILWSTAEKIWKCVLKYHTIMIYGSLKYHWTYLNVYCESLVENKAYLVYCNFSSKRGIDFGLGRGFSGSQAAKHFMGMAAARYSGGPGKRKRSPSY